MSTTGPLVVKEVWRILQDTQPEHVVVEDVIRQAVVRTVAKVAKVIGIGAAWSNAVITTTTTDRDYTLTGSDEWQQFLALRYHSDGVLLTKRDSDYITTMQQGQGPVRGRQYEFALEPNAARVLVASFGGYPDQVETLDAKVSLVPTEWPQGSATPPTIPFSTTAIRALELLTASAVFKSLGDDKRVQLDLNPNCGDDWYREGMDLAIEEQLVIIRMKRSEGIDLSYDSLLAWGRA